MRPFRKITSEEVLFLYSCRLLAFKFTEKHGDSRLQIFFKIGVLKIFAIFTGKHLCWSLFLIKRDSNTGVFPWILQIFKNSFFYRTPPVAASENMNNFSITLKDLSNSKSIFSKKFSRRLLLNSNKFFKNRCLLNLRCSSFCILDIHIFLVPNNLSKSPLYKLKSMIKKEAFCFSFFFSVGIFFFRRRYFRMSPEQFHYLLALVKSLIKKKGTNLRKLISAAERL